MNEVISEIAYSISALLLSEKNLPTIKDSEKALSGLK